MDERHTERGFWRRREEPSPGWLIQFHKDASAYATRRVEAEKAKIRTMLETLPKEDVIEYLTLKHGGEE